MLNDIVLDTNVLLHADNHEENRQPAALELLMLLVNTKTLLCVDVGYHSDKSKNRSLIAAEYYSHVRFGSVAYGLIIKLATSMRIKEISSSLKQREKKIVNQCIRNPRDRTFVAVAINSVEKVLVSHDFEDFDIKKRRHINREVGIQVLQAAACLKRLI